MQDFLVFPGRSISKSRLVNIRNQYPNVEEISLKTEDNITLHGWYLKNTEKKISPLVIYFGGNAEEVSWKLNKGESFPGYSILLMNYRGFGISEGKPSEKKLLKDALFLYDTFSKREDIDSEKIVVLGRSLGTGVATYVAANRKVEKVILISPYDSITNVGKGIFPFLPIKFILKHNFNSAALAGKINEPVLIIAAPNDRIVPYKNTMKLYSKWKGETKLVKINEACHNSISNFEIFWTSIREFLNNKH